MYGDDVGALIVDPGTLTTKIGYAGEDCPKFVPSSVLGVNVAEKSTYFPLKENIRRDNTAIKHAFRMEAGMMSMDTDVFENILERSLGNDGLRINSADHPILFTEPNRHNTQFREQLVDLAFEKLNAPAVFVAKRAVLSAFAAARSSALVVDIGHSGTSIAPVVEGYCLQRPLKEFSIGGAALEAELADTLAAKGVTLGPSFGWQRQLLADGSVDMSVGSIKAVDTSSVDPSYMQWATKGVLRDIKESILKVSETKLQGEQLEQLMIKSRRPPTDQAGGSAAKDLASAMTLPDGTIVDLSAQAKLLPEALFSPTDVLRSGHRERDFQGLAKAVHDVLLASDADVRRELAGAIVVTGGGSLIEGVPERLNHDLSDAQNLGSSLKFRVLASSAQAERRFGAWVGGSIFASLGSAQQMWISRQEWEEHGSRIVEKKCA